MKEMLQTDFGLTLSIVAVMVEESSLPSSKPLAVVPSPSDGCAALEVFFPSL